MGLGFESVAKPRSGFWGRRAFDLDELTMVLLARASVPDPLQRLSKRFPANGSKTIFRVSPLEEDLSFSVGADGSLLASAKTSSLGPGYHAYLVTALDTLADELGFEWEETEEHFDETGYFADRDFERLQGAFTDWFEDLARIVTEKSEHLPHLQLAMASDFLPAGGDGMIATLRGWRPVDAFAPGIRISPDRYFPWWEEEISGPTALALAEAHLWMLFPWRAPLSDDERAVGEVARDLLMRVKPLPTEWAGNLHEIIEVLGTETFKAPREDGIGYLRGEMRQTLVGDWTVRLPGWYWTDLEDEGRTSVYWASDRSVYFSSLSFERSQQLDLAAWLDEKPADVRFQDEHAAYRGSYSDNPSDSWPNGRQFQGQVLSGGHDASTKTKQHSSIVTITYADKSLDLWAEAVFRSVSPPPTTTKL